MAILATGEPIQVPRVGGATPLRLCVSPDVVLRRPLQGTEAVTTTVTSTRPVIDTDLLPDVEGAEVGAAAVRVVPVNILPFPQTLLRRAPLTLAP